MDEVDDVDKMDNWSVHLCPHRLCGRTPIEPSGFSSGIA